jgi:hypothetical protein
VWLLAGHSPASAIVVCLPPPLPAITPQVLDSCMGMGVPVAGYVGGGYHSDLDVLARRHCWLHRAAAQMWRDHRM